MKRFFLRIYDYFEQHRAALWITLGTVVLLLCLSLLRLHFVEDISSFLPSSKQNERINYAYSHLGGDNKLIINISQKDTSHGIDYQLLSETADKLVESLSVEKDDKLIKSVLYQIDDSQIEEVMTFVLDNLPYFLTEEDYARMDSCMDYAHIHRQLENEKQMLASPIAVMRPMIQRDPMFFSTNVLQSLNAFKMDDSYHVEDGYIFNKAGTEAVIVVTSQYPLSETKNNGLLIKRIEQACSATEKAMGGQVDVRNFGASQVSLTNSTQIKKDSIFSIALALVFILALLIYYYRNVRSIVLILISITFGGLLAMGLIAWLKNPVSLIAVGMSSIIIGIAINYPIHFLSHFKRTDDKRQIIKEIVTPLLIGNITTVGAFISLMFISSPAMKDLGLFSALLLVGTILFVLVFLPHFMGERYQGSERGLAFAKVAEFKPENIKGIFWIILTLTIVFSFFSSRTSFDTNMHHINYMTKEQKAEFEKLTAAADPNVQTVYCIAEGKTLDEALVHNETANESLRKLPIESVNQVSGIGNFLPSKQMQQKRIDRWNRFWENRREQYCNDLDKAAEQSGFNPEAFAPNKEIVNNSYAVQDADYFDLIRKQLAANYMSVENGRVLIYNLLKVNKNNTSDIEKRLNRTNANVFAFTESSIASRLVGALSHDFDYVLYICGFIVFAFLIFTFGSLEISIMAFLPLFTAWIWILGIMGIFGLQFNIVNIILATFIFGMGDDYSIFVTEGLIYEHAYGKKMLSQFKNSIILSASIMFIGIGMLIFAKHPAMRSLAAVTMIGMVSVVLMAYIIPPIIFKWMTMRKGHPRRQPITIGSLFRSAIGFPYFFLGVCILSCGGFFWFVLGKRNDENKFKYHKLLKKLMLSTAHRIPKSSFRVENPHNEDFETPAVIICNHQSHFDLLYTLSLTPKLIVLTNDWAWNTPLYRRIVRNADYLPASYGMDSNFLRIKTMVEKGYSVLIFPEGTRSASQEILRFHQGAFHLAEDLGLDILPIVAHGIGDMFPKNDTCIHHGNVTISIMERIKPDNTRFRQGKTALETTRLLRHFYQDEYAKLKERCETPEYLYDIVYHNYIYKGKDVRKDCIRKLKQLAALKQQLERLPKTGKVLYKNCGNGELSLLTALHCKHLTVTAFNEDADAITLAAHCLSVPDNLTYTSEMPNDSGYDVILDEKSFIS